MPHPMGIVCRASRFPKPAWLAPDPGAALPGWNQRRRDTDMPLPHGCLVEVAGLESCPLSGALLPGTGGTGANDG